MTIGIRNRYKNREWLERSLLIQKDLQWILGFPPSTLFKVQDCLVRKNAASLKHYELKESRGWIAGYFLKAVRSDIDLC